MPETITRYFPDTFNVLVDFRHGQRWDTLIEMSPNGLSQRTSLHDEPMRTLYAQVYHSTPADFRVTRDFVKGNKGMTVPFYVFIWYGQNFSGMLATSSYSTVPITLPIKTGTITQVYDDGAPVSHTSDDGGAGGEKRLVTIGGPPAGGSVITFDATDTRERLGVRQATDQDSFPIDFNRYDNIAPQIVLDLIEVL